jgi:hypothetical protein
MDRLGWILDGLNGAADRGGDAADVLAPAGCIPAHPGHLRQRTMRGPIPFWP